MRAKRHLPLLLLLASAAPFSAISTRSAPRREEQPLLPGWTAALDPRTKRTYYWNRETLETRWRRPVAPEKKAEPAEAEVPASQTKQTARPAIRREKSTPQSRREPHAGSVTTAARAPVLSMYLTTLLLGSAYFL